jgi:GR25 family glycosyltransferase involved in LPS biosynthesis
MVYHFVINLPNREKRMMNAIQQLEKVNLADLIIRKRGVTPEEAYKKRHLFLSYEALMNIKYPKSCIIMPSYKALACAMSHIQVWNQILDLRMDGAFVVEDDIQINNVDKFNIWYKKVVKLVDDDSKAYLVTFNSRTNYNYEDYDNYNYDFFNMQVSSEKIERTANRFTGCHFYYINKKMITEIIDSVNDMTYQFDIHLGEVSKRYLYYSTYLFLNVNTDSIQQRTDYISDTQPYFITPQTLFNISNRITPFLPFEIIEKIVFFTKFN